MRISIAAMALILYLASPIPAMAWSGNALMGICKDRQTNTRSADACRGLIIGAVHGLNVGALRTLYEQNSDKTSLDIAAKEMKEKRVLFCPPDSVTNEQVTDMVLNYLEEHPDKRDQNFAESVFDVVRKAWPKCQ